MNKARKINNTRSGAKRLVSESLILSSTRFVSSRVVRFFEKGKASPILRSVKTVDSFVSEKIAGPVFQKTELRKNFIMPARNAVASFFANNSFFQKLDSLRIALLNSSLRSAGIFLLTFGIYAAAIFLLKRFVTLTAGEAGTDDLIIAALTVIAGLLLTAFGDKSVIGALGGGKITGSLLSGVLGVNDSSLNKIPSKPKTSIGISFLLGSLLGVLTMFFTPLSILFTISCIAVIAVIMNIPEFGLLLAAMSVSFLPVEWISVIAGVTMISYLLKCLRLKRNLRFGTADAVVLLLYIVMFIACILTEGEINNGEHYLLCFISLYFAAKNLICSEKLLMQTFNALCMGVFVGMLMYILGEFAPLIGHRQISVAAAILSSHCLSADMMALLASAVMPFALASFTSITTKRRDLLFILVAAACAFVSDSLLFYVLLAVSLFLFIASAFKAPVGAAVSAAVTIPPLLAIVADFAQSTAVLAFASKNFDKSLEIPADITAGVFWEGLDRIGGSVSVVLFAVAAVFVLQRVVSSTVFAWTKRVTLICGTVAASAVMMLVGTFVFNFFADLRMVFIMWFIFGICGSVYKVYSNSNNSNEEV